MNKENGFIIKITESISQNLIGIMFMLVNGAVTATGQLLFKMASIEDFSIRIPLFVNIICSWLFKSQIGTRIILLTLGIMAQILATFIKLKAFKHGSFSVLNPMMSLALVFTIIGGCLILGEIVTGVQILAVLLIIIGVILISAGDI